LWTNDCLDSMDLADLAVGALVVDDVDILCHDSLAVGPF
jgi:hypothetical protein